MHCPAPLPEEPAGPLLAKMLVPVPYKAPKKEASKKVKKTRGGLHRREASDAKSEDSSYAPSSEGEEEEAEEDEPHYEGGRKRAVSPVLGGRIAQEGERFPPRDIHRGCRQQPTVGSQGPTPREVVSIWKHICVRDCLWI